jgi:exodeoxyribonuclease V alpha subunit
MSTSDSQLSLPDSDPIVVDGVVERIVHVAANGTTIAALAIGEQDTTITIAGPLLLGIQPGETLRVRGTWTRSARHGDTFRVTGCEYVLPAAVHAIRRYLGSGLIKGIGPTIAQAIVDHFGTDTITIIDHTPHRLREVHLIGRARLASIQSGWAEQQTIRETMIFLQGIGVSPALAARIHTQYGADALRAVQHHPYQLIEDVRGIGFLIADQIALAVGIPEQSPDRLHAALLHALERARSTAGHCFVPYSTLIAQAAELIGQHHDLLCTALHRLRDQRRVVIEDAHDYHRTPTGDPVAVVFTGVLHRAETTLAQHLRRLHHSPSQMPRAVRTLLDAHPDGIPAEALAGVQTGAPLLSAQQDDAVRAAFTHTVSVLTGGPGCGKSLTVAAIAVLARATGMSITLAAPTGRAAQRLTELTGLPARTVHRLINTRPDPNELGILFDLHDALRADLIVIDEASMLDVSIAATLVSKISSGSHLLLVGDVDQLPSVGPGAVLRDILRTNHIPRTRLDHVYRQGPGSTIVHAARAVVTGTRPTNTTECWFHAVPEDDTTTIPHLVVDIATQRLPAKQHISPRDVQVLAPGNNHDTGAIALNRILQDTLNPHRDDHTHYWADNRPFRIGDKVMPIRNDYTKGTHGVFNGSTGTITLIDLEHRAVRVLLDGGDTALYGFDELHDLAHGYAITVHRAQGSEYPYVVLPLSRNSPNILLRRNLLYTAITRAKKAVVIVGHESALTTALKNRMNQRNTQLTTRLTELSTILDRQ